MELLDQMGFQQLIQNLPFANLTDLLAILSLRAMPEYCSQTDKRFVLHSRPTAVRSTLGIALTIIAFN